MNTNPDQVHRFQIKIDELPDGGRRVGFQGSFVLQELEHVTGRLQTLAQGPFAGHTCLDLQDLQYVDSAGALAILELADNIKAAGGSCSLDHVSPKVQGLLNLIDVQAINKPPLIGAGRRQDFISRVGDGFLAFLRDSAAVIIFLGEIIIDLAAVCFRPSIVRWRDVVLTMKRAGVEGLPIISLIALLLGLIIAFMSSLQLRQFGANIFVASLLAIAMVRELGPIMTAILVAGRSGSAFAAEIGTMKVNEEVDALTVMGLNPMHFLTLPKVIASLIVVPLLTMYANLLGIIGGLIVGVTLLDLTVYSYIQETRNILTVFDFVSSFIKTLVFAFLIAAIGCQRGFQVRGGAAAVGEATTSAVVAAIFMIIVVDSVFAIVLTYIPL
ncbi:MAG: ABC transporter permease [Desulfobacca sp.]|uniref:ABC transporter permease n=1 Tax=Desulfobacca sp. TaxID=2067990 RepID=UPI00404A86CD